MELVSPGIGLIFWMTLAFLAVLFILGKYAWKPIMKALKERELTIHEALNAAERAREEITQLQVNNEILIREAKNERDLLLGEARKLKDSIIEEARQKASEEANRIVINAKESIHYEKMAAMSELKNQLADLSLEIAKKILKRELADPQKQEAFVNELLTDVKFN
ncbi:MAG: F0F1 ATP synthase subunit B [Bacteroidetes bacterium]|nr:F0F1 ATP synthase subunit B [Bacteroidota bacterium]